MKKLLAMLLVLTMAVSVTACGGKGDEKADAPSETQEGASQEEAGAEDAAGTEASADGAEYVVGICQLVQHDALDAATQGFKDALTEELGDKVTFDEQNASGDVPTCSTIVNQFVSDEVDLILANATPALQAAQAGTGTIPILGTSVTEYGVALNISDFDGTVGTNISGTSDLAPLDQQAQIRESWIYLQAVLFRRLQ